MLSEQHNEYFDNISSKIQKEKRLKKSLIADFFGIIIFYVIFLFFSFIFREIISSSNLIDISLAIVISLVFIMLVFDGVRNSYKIFKIKITDKEVAYYHLYCTHNYLKTFIEKPQAIVNQKSAISSLEKLSIYLNRDYGSSVGLKNVRESLDIFKLLRKNIDSKYIPELVEADRKKTKEYLIKFKNLLIDIHAENTQKLYNELKDDLGGNERGTKYKFKFWLKYLSVSDPIKYLISFFIVFITWQEVILLLGIPVFSDGGSLISAVVAITGLTYALKRIIDRFFGLFERGKKGD